MHALPRRPEDEVSLFSSLLDKSMVAPGLLHLAWCGGYIKKNKLRHGRILQFPHPSERFP